MLSSLRVFIDYFDIAL